MYFFFPGSAFRRFLAVKESHREKHAKLPKISLQVGYKVIKVITFSAALRLAEGATIKAQMLEDEPMTQIYIYIYIHICRCVLSTHNYTV